MRFSLDSKGHDLKQKCDAWLCATSPLPVTAPNSLTWRGVLKSELLEVLLINKNT